MSTHKLFAPSKSHQWVPCPGSLALEKLANVPDSSSSYADEGTAAHAYASRCLEERCDASKYVDKWSIVVNDDPSNTFDATPEMAENVQVYLDEVRGRMGIGHTLLVEQFVSLDYTLDVSVPDGAGGTQKQGGTADAIIVSPDGDVTVIDLKYGAGEQVDVEENMQALTYGAGVLETFGDIVDMRRFKLVIVQPRIGGVSEWPAGDEWLPAEKILEHGKKLRAAAKLALKAYSAEKISDVKLGLLAPGKKTCRWCKAKHLCPALEMAAAREMDGEFQDLTKVAEAPPIRASRLGQQWAALPFLEMYASAVKQEVFRQVNAGMTVLGPDGEPLKMVAGRGGKRQWKDPKTAEAMLCGVLPPDKVYAPREIITAPAAAKILDKKRTAATWEPFKALIETAKPSLTIALGSDPTPAYDPTASGDEFEDLSV